MDEGLKLDWWAAVLKSVAPDEQAKIVSCLVEILGGEWSSSRGWYGYPFALRHQTGALILWGARDDMGVYISLGGDALAYFSDRVDALMRTFDWSCNRIDIACDTSEVSVDDVISLGDGIVCRARSRRLVIDMTGGGKTLYIGSMSNGSRKLIRIYDKLRESKSKAEGLTQWTRVEVQLRGDYAHAAWRYVMAGGSFADVVARAIDFREAARGAKRGWKRVSWWQNLLKSVTNGFRYPSRERLRESVERIEKWLSKQVSRSLAFLDAVKGRSAIDRLIDVGKLRLDPALVACCSP